MKFVDIRTENLVPSFLRQVLEEKPQWMASALKSAGFWAKKELEAGIKSGAPAGQRYAAGMSAARRRDIEDVMNAVNPKRLPKRAFLKLGKLRQAVKYDKTRAAEGIVKVGWTSRSSVRLGTLHEKGFFQPITAKMRRMFFAAGIGISKGRSHIALPKRSTFKPMHPIIQVGAAKQAQLKIISYLEGNVERSQAKSRRVYRVYG